MTQETQFERSDVQIEEIQVANDDLIKALGMELNSPFPSPRIRVDLKEQYAFGELKTDPDFQSDHSRGVLSLAPRSLLDEDGEPQDELDLPWGATVGVKVL